MINCIICQGTGFNRHTYKDKEPCPNGCKPEVDVDTERYKQACHAMQTGVGVQIQHDKTAEPKHLRVGINSAHVSHAALIKLLVSINMITQAEYMKFLADEMEIEVKRYEKEIQARLGRDDINIR